MNDLVITDDEFRDRLIPEFKNLDLAFGSSENNFMLVLPDYQKMTTGEYFYIAESEWGGIVDRYEIGYTTGKPKLTYSGRSWHGILAHKIICPDTGSDYLTYSGDINRIIDSLIQRQSLQERFIASFDSCGYTASGRFDRYTDMYTALKKLCKSVGCKLKIRTTTEHKVELSAVKATPIYLDSDQYELRLGKGGYTNHLVCLGKGDLKNRTVVHLYSDEVGHVSQIQTFFGIAEIAETYDYNNAEREELIEKGTEQLQKAFGDACQLDVDDNLQLDVGDTVRCVSVETGIDVEATVEKVVVDVSNDTANISYEVGNIRSRS